MPIRIDQMLKEEETRAAGYLWTTENDPTWMRYQADLEQGTMRGFHVSKTNGAIPNVTPFLYTFPVQGQAANYHYVVALAAFADIGKERLIREGQELEETSMASQVSDWQDFMSAFGGGGQKVDESLSGDRFITYPKDLVVSSQIIRYGRRGDLSLPRTPAFRIGARMSGFDAYDIATSRGLPRKLQVGPIGDPDLEQAREALASVERPSSHAVSWYGTRDPEVAKLRMQAAKAMPILAGLLAERTSLARTVDEMAPIQPALIETTGLAKAGVKRIGKLTQPSPAGRIFDQDEAAEGEDALGVNRARQTRLTGTVPVDMALRYLSHMPPDRTPQDNESWLKFNDILSAVAIPLHNATSIPVPKILEASKGDWIKFHAALARAADFEPDNFDRRTMALTTIDSMEAIDHFNRTAVLPQMLASIRGTGEPEPMISREFVITGAEIARDIVVGKAKNVAVSMMEMARRYASRIPAMGEIEGKSMNVVIDHTQFEKYGATGFPTLTEDFEAANGLVVRPLRNAEELQRESARLAHCVGAYAHTARATNTFIFSVQDKSAETSYSTFELRLPEIEDAVSAATNIRNVQHRAHGNGVPSEECKAAYKEFMKAVRSREIDLNLKEISQWRQHLSETGEAGRSVARQRYTEANWASVLELDWTDEEIRDDYWQEWGEVLGGRVAKSPHPGVIYTEKKARDLVGAMSPRAAAIMMEEERQAREAREAEKSREEEVSPQ